MVFMLSSHDIVVLSFRELVIFYLMENLSGNNIEIKKLFVVNFHDDFSNETDKREIHKCTI